MKKKLVLFKLADVSNVLWCKSVTLFNQSNVAITANVGM